jgi:hypothetical protein
MNKKKQIVVVDEQNILIFILHFSYLDQNTI